MLNLSMMFQACSIVDLSSLGCEPMSFSCLTRKFTSLSNFSKEVMHDFLEMTKLVVESIELMTFLPI